MRTALFVTLLLGGLAATNPDLDDYQHFVRHHLAQRLEAMYQEVIRNPDGELARRGVAPFLTAVALLEGGTGDYLAQALLPGTTRKDYLIASVYTTHVMDKVDVVYLGIFRKFIQLDGLHVSPASTATPPAARPAGMAHALWESDWGSGIQATATTRPCQRKELTAEGYQYAITVDIPVARLAKREHAWAVQGERAQTLDGCWRQGTDDLVRAKLIRKKDGKVYVINLNFQDGSWRHRPAR